MNIKYLLGALLVAAIPLSAGAAIDAKYKSDIDAWRAKAEKSLRSDNGWLTLAGRHELSAGVNTVGTASDNKIVLAPGIAPDNVMIVFSETAWENWAFAGGRLLHAA